MRNDIALLPDFITPKVALSLVPAFTSAYAMAAEAAESIDFLGWELRAQILPNLKNWAVEFELKRRADEGSISFVCNVAPNARRNHKHIELRNGNWVLTVSQVHRPIEAPREAIYRNELCLDGQTAMQDFVKEDINGEVYAILTHGWQTISPAFINCGILSPDKQCWAQQINVLDVVRHMALLDASPATEEIKLRFKEQSVEHVLEENTLS